MKYPLPRLLMVALLAGTYMPSALAQHHGSGPAYITNEAATAALSVLPPESAVRQTLESMPQLRSSAINIDLAKSGKSRLDAGHYEWTVRAANNRRSDQLGGSFNEQELSIERPVRWFGKAGKDAAIGEKGIELASASHADTWHEASRSLMADWFEALREIAATRRLQEQVEIAEQLRTIAEKRVKAGDAARLELMQADTESKRVGALLQQAQLREEQVVQMLKNNYPGLPAPKADALPTPSMLAESSGFWFDKIMDDNHELELAQAEADLFTLQAARIASDNIPDPTIGLRAGRERNGQERIFGISIAIPLPGAARNADKSSAFLKARMASERFTQTRLKVTANAHRVITDSQRSYSIWQTMQQIRQQSQAQATTMMSAYKLGEASLSDALNTRRQALDATLAAESAQIDALAGLARLQLDAHLIWAIE